jgi:general stress protein 26
MPEQLKAEEVNSKTDPSVSKPVHRSMAVAKRTGPDFLFLANAHSQKFNDIESNPGAVTITFQNSSNQDWVSITGKAVTSNNEDPRIKEIWSRGTSAWFGDLGDGVHTGKPEDPRMKLIEIQSKCKCCFLRLAATGVLTSWRRHLLLQGRSWCARLWQGGPWCYCDRWCRKDRCLERDEGG